MATKIRSILSTRRLYAIFGAVGVAVGGVSLIRATFVLGNDHGSIRSALEGSGPATTPPTSDEPWAAELSGLLRLGTELPEHEVRTNVAEAREHAAGMRGSMTEELGTPGA